MKSEKKTIGLCGISHVKNYGCEAIIRSTYNMLRECMPDCRIIYTSRNSVQDGKILKDLDLDIVQLSRKPDLFSRGFNKLCEKLRLRSRISFDRYREICKDIDLVVSVGGDIYTIDKNLAKKSGYRCNNRLVKLEEYAYQHGSKIILYGASIGPFPKENGNEDYYRNHLNIMSLIICRENESIKYLNEINIKATIAFSPDPAFFLRQTQFNLPMNERSGIAVNLSPRIISHDKDVDAQKDKLAATVIGLYRHLGETVYLVPHVYSDSIGDDDLRFLKDIHLRIPGIYKNNILTHEESGFMQTKLFLAQRKMVISARMHCAINAMSEGTPTILISYSQKSIGMAKYIYGTEEWVLSDASLSEQLIPCAEKMLEQSEYINKFLLNRMNDIRKPDARSDIQQKIVRFANE